MIIRKTKNGFSLIELIVVITIIAVITAVGLVNFGGANRKARDGRRMADLEKIRMALEMARQVGNTYPPTITVLVNGGYLQSEPKDPKDVSSYQLSTPTYYTYTLDARMEDLGSTNGSFATSCGGIACNYRVTNP